MEQELLYENDKMRMFRTFESVLLTRHCQCKNNNNHSLLGYKCAYVLFKERAPSEYVLMNEYGYIIAADESYTRMACHIDGLKDLNGNYHK